MNRRDFLMGASAVAVAAAVPLPAIAMPAEPPMSGVVLNAIYQNRYPVFLAGDKVYKGVILREVEDLTDMLRALPSRDDVMAPSEVRRVRQIMLGGVGHGR